MITFYCGGCQRQLRAAERLAGKKARCPKCSHLTTIPTPTAADTATIPPAPPTPVTDDVTLPPTSPPSGIETPTLPPQTVPDPNVEAGRQATAGVSSLTQLMAFSSSNSVGTIPGYEFVRELGRGGMGVIFLARQLQPRRLVALKMILAGDHAGSDHLARFRAEAEAVARLQHPGIVQIHEVGEHNGRAYLTLEYVDGGNLAEYLRDNRLSWTRMAELMLQLAKAVHHAHTQGIIHRDLKPPNVLLSFDEVDKKGTLPFSIKIADFGLAKQLEGMVSVAPQGPMTQTGAILGTPSYMAPEQIQTDGQPLGPAVDVYALGVMFYEMLTGKVPFEGESTLDIIVQVATGDPTLPRKQNPKIPQDLETICLKCLQKDPQKRYETAKALADDLDRYLHDQPILARRQTTAERVFRWLKKRKEIVYLFTGALVVLCVGLAVLYWMNPGTTKPTGGSATKILPDDLALVPANSVGFVTINVAELRKRRRPAERLVGLVLGSNMALRNAFAVFKAYLNEAEQKSFGLIDNIERVTLFLPTSDYQQAGLTVAMSRPYDWSVVHELAKLQRFQESQDTQKTKFLTDRRGQFIWGFNDRVLVWGSNQKVMDRLATKTTSSGPLTRVLQKVAEGDLLVVGVRPESQNIGKLSNTVLPKEDPLVKITPFLQARVMSVVFDLPMKTSDKNGQKESYFAGIRLETELEFGDEQEARKAHRTLEVGKVVGKNLERQFADLQPDRGKSIPLLVKNLSDALSNQWKQSGRHLSLSINQRWSESELSSTAKWFRKNAGPKIALSAHQIQSQNNLKILVLALHTYHVSAKKLPPQAILDKQTKKPLLSWRVRILPFIGQSKLFHQFHRNEPWDSPNNKELLKYMPDVFRVPKGIVKKQADKAGEIPIHQTHTYYQLVTGPKTLFQSGKSYSFTNITDGTRHTMLIVEAKKPVPWTKPEDVPFTVPIAPKLGGQFANGFNAAFADGSVRFIPNTTPEQTLQLLTMPNDGMPIPLLPK